MAVRGLPADAEPAADLGQCHLLHPGQQEYLARARWQRGDDRVEMAQLFGVQQVLLRQRRRIGEGVQLGIIQRFLTTALALPASMRSPTLTRKSWAVPGVAAPAPAA